MNRGLKKVKKWSDANHLALNIDKTNFVIFIPLRKKIAEQEEKRRQFVAMWKADVTFSALGSGALARRCFRFF